MKKKIVLFLSLILILCFTGPVMSENRQEPAEAHGYKNEITVKDYFMQYF